MIRALIVAALVAALPSPAHPCANVTTLAGDDAVRTVATAEAYLERGKYRAALSMLHDIEFESEALTARAADIRAIYAMRMKTARSDLRWVVARFKARSEAHPKDVRLRARLAEAYEAAGETTLARAILVELDAADLMPDAFAFRTLARVSDGDDRRDALLACGVRAKNKAICTAPSRPAS